jgi:hypothetical protein
VGALALVEVVEVIKGLNTPRVALIWIITIMVAVEEQAVMVLHHQVGALAVEAVVLEQLLIFMVQVVTQAAVAFAEVALFA